MRINEVVIDNVHGYGAVPNNNEVDYLGLRVLMAPNIFLQLAAGGVSDGQVDDSHFIAQAIKSGKGIGAPFLGISLPKEWLDGDYSLPARIISHEGRHRMVAVRRLEGNNPIETHIFVKNHRNRHITPEMKIALNKMLLPQAFSSIVDTLDFSDQIRFAIKGPLFRYVN